MLSDGIDVNGLSRDLTQADVSRDISHVVRWN